MEAKMLAMIAVVALLSAMVGGFMTQQTAEKTIKQTLTANLAQQPAAAPAVAQTPPARSAPAPAAPTAAKKDVSGQIFLDEEIDFSTLPWSKELELPTGRYEVYFESDQPIKLSVVSETGSTKATTQFGPKCCKTSGFYTIDVNNGEGGKYTVVFDDSQLTLADARPTKGLVKIGKIGGI